MRRFKNAFNDFGHEFYSSSSGAAFYAGIIHDFMDHRWSCMKACFDGGEKGCVFRIKDFSETPCEKDASTCRGVTAARFTTECVACKNGITYLNITDLANRMMSGYRIRLEDLPANGTSTWGFNADALQRKFE